MTKEPRKLSQADAFRVSLQSLRPEFAKALPSQIQPDKFVRVVMTAIQITPALLTADRQTLWAACMKCATDGLLPDGREAALVVYKTKNGPVAQYLPMVGGLLKKIRNSGELATLTSQVVYEKDHFRHWIDTDGDHLEHTPFWSGDRGERVGAYALAKTKDGFIYFEFMTVEEILAVKDASKAKEHGPWAGDFENEMWRKTVIKRLSKRLPMSTDLETLMRRDDELFDFNPETKTVSEAKTPARLASLLEPKQQLAPPQEEEISESETESDEQTGTHYDTHDERNHLR